MFLCSLVLSTKTTGLHIYNQDCFHLPTDRARRLAPHWPKVIGYLLGSGKEVEGRWPRQASSAFMWFVWLPTACEAGIIATYSYISEMILTASGSQPTSIVSATRRLLGQWLSSRHQPQAMTGQRGWGYLCTYVIVCGVFTPIGGCSETLGILRRNDKGCYWVTLWGNVVRCQLWDNTILANSFPDSPECCTVNRVTELLQRCGKF